MAIPALSVGSYNRLKSQIAQFRATTGRDPSPQILQALMETDVSQAQARALQEEELASKKEAQSFQERYQTGQAETQKEQFALSLENQKNQFEKTIGLQSTQSAEQLAIQREQLAAQARAARISGITQLGETAAVGAYLLKDTAIGKSAGEAVSGAISTTGKALSGALNIGSMSTPSLSSATIGGSSLTSSLGAEYGALETAGATGFGATAGAEAGGAAISEGLGSAIGTAGGPAALASAIGGFAGEKVLGGAVGKKTGGDIGAVGAGAVVGNMILPGAGAVVGGAIGGVTRVISRVFGGGSILCTELYRQGLVTRQLVALATIYKNKYLTDEDYQDYLRVFTPIVSNMQSYSFVTKLVAPFGKCLFIEVASRVGKKYKSTILGKLVLGGTWVVCKTVGRVHSWLS